MNQSVLIKAMYDGKVILSWHGVAVPRKGEVLRTLGGPTQTFTVSEVAWWVFLYEDMRPETVGLVRQSEYVVLQLHKT